VVVSGSDELKFVSGSPSPAAPIIEFGLHIQYLFVWNIGVRDIDTNK
jgi:hypothetical protein